MAKKPPYGNSPGPKTPYAQDSPPLIINRNQRKQLEQIDGPMESVGAGMKPRPAAPRPAAPPPMRTPPRQPTNWDKIKKEAEEEERRKRPPR